MAELGSVATKGGADAARKRAAIELIARHERALRRTARRFSLDPDDAEDAYQRALEILLTKAPTTDQRQLIRWTQTVTKHEAMAVRESREKLLGANVPRDADYDPLASLPAGGDGPDEQAARSEVVARSREALAALKPAELRALSLLASGCSYAEIGRITGFSQTKINRVLAEGRERFRGLLASSEDGSRCRELRPLLSSFCDDEASTADAAVVRAHLRACPGCRATLRAYRAAPRVAAGLVPTLPASRSLFERVHDAVDGIWSRLAGSSGADSTAAVAATGGTRGVGMAALAKLAAVCAGAAGGAACVATGLVPAPLLADDPQPKAAIERRGEPADETAPPEASAEPERPPEPEPQSQAPPRHASREHAADSATPATGAVEYEPAPASLEAEAAPSVPEGSPVPSAGESTGSAAGEFGP